MSIGGVSGRGFGLRGLLALGACVAFFSQGNILFVVIIPKVVATPLVNSSLIFQIFYPKNSVLSSSTALTVTASPVSNTVQVAPFLFNGSYIPRRSVYLWHESA